MRKTRRRRVDKWMDRENNGRNERKLFLLGTEMASLVSRFPAFYYRTSDERSIQIKREREGGKK
jgi:hypothetical protein